MSENRSTRPRRKRRSREAVSYNMSRIRSSNTVIERTLGSAMHSIGLRYRKQYDIEGRPDFAFPSEKIAVFCDSSFWHGRYWHRKEESRPKVNKDFWNKKILRNIQRDKEVKVLLRKQGWAVLRFWDNQVLDNPEGCAEMVRCAVERRRCRT